MFRRIMIRKGDGRTKISLNTWGSDGDIRSFIALSHGLAARGHDVTLALTSVDGKDYASHAERGGFRIIQITAPDVSGGNLSEIGQSMLATSDVLRQLSIILRYAFDPVVDEMLRVSEEIAEGADVCVGHFLVYPFELSAERRGIPYVMLYLNPLIASREIVPLGAPNLGRFMNGLFWRLGGIYLDRALGKRVNALRRRVGAPAVRSLSRALNSPECLSIVAVSPSLTPRPPDWHPNYRMTGFLNVPEAAEPWEMPPAMREFIHAGLPPVYMTFGSMLTIGDVFTVQGTRLLYDAALMSGQRAIIQSPVGGDMPTHERIHMTGPVPHKYVFPHVSAVLHHCGAGSTQSALLAGRPAVAVPFVLDQHYWARELHHAGVATRPLKARDASPSMLARLVDEAARSKAMRTRADALGERMRAEDGVAGAVSAIEGIALRKD